MGLKGGTSKRERDAETSGGRGRARRALLTHASCPFRTPSPDLRRLIVVFSLDMYLSILDNFAVYIFFFNFYFSFKVDIQSYFIFVSDVLQVVRQLNNLRSDLPISLVPMWHHA